MLIKEIVEATNGELLSGDLNNKVIGFTQDSRKCAKDFLYIPVKGEIRDGHEFISNAFQNGASSVLTEIKIDYPDKNVILVKDTIKALGDIARYKRINSKAIVIGITGSVGKTSTKDMIYSVVSQKYKTLKTEGNYNNHLGVPLTILRYIDEEAMVIEMGMNHLNEIDYLTKIALPDIAVITNVGTAHIGELGSRENILKAKLEIANGLKSGGYLILNKDCDLLNSIMIDNINVKYVGINTNADLIAKNIVLNENGSQFTIDYNNKAYDVYVPVAGEHFILNALLAIEVGICLNIPMENIIDGIKTFKLTENRADILQLSNGIKVYDGSYNANLDSMLSSIDVLNTYKCRKIAILGDMLELGNFSEKLHREVGIHVNKSDIDVILLVGEDSKYIMSEITDNTKKVKHFANNKLLIEYLYNEIKPNDVILVKASHGLKLSEVVDSLKEKFN